MRDLEQDNQPAWPHWATPAWYTWKWAVEHCSQNELAERCGYSGGPAIVNSQIAKFIRAWMEVDNLNFIYLEDRQRLALKALQRFIDAGGVCIEPETLAGHHKEYKEAQREHAFLLRCEGLSLQEIAARLGITVGWAGSLVKQRSTRLNRAMQRTRVTLFS